MDKHVDEAAAAQGTRADEVIFLPPAAGRTYDAGSIRMAFKADGAVDNRYCVSEWWLEAGQPGPGPHSHEGNELFTCWTEP